MGRALLGRSSTDGVISDLADHTVMGEDGAVRSVQAANVEMPVGELQEMWTPTYLERLARTYWKFLSRVSLGLIRVEYTPDERRVVLLRSPFVLLRFGAPKYDIRENEERGIVRWLIHDGVLVGKRDSGYLEIDVRKGEPPRPGYEQAHVEVEVANFYPRLAEWIARWFYKATQSRIHVLVTHAFLRSLARLDLAESRVGRFATVEQVPDPRLPPPRDRPAGLREDERAPARQGR
jgi:hypothetical protein